MIIRRVGEKGKYTFVDSGNKQIHDIEILEYITKLVIPPNYNNVKIFYQVAGQPKILYQGYDSKERLQRIYSDEWKKKATRRKFCELLNLAEQIHNITASVRKEMVSEKLTKKKCIAMIIRIVMVCYFRIGNKRYQELYGSFGAMNIKKKHVVFKKDGDGKEYMYLSFSGKKGVLNTCSIYDVALIREVKKILRFRDDDEMVFKWSDHGVGIPVRAIDINYWLKTFDPNITSKDFRTYDSNILLIIFLTSQIDPVKLSVTARKKIIVVAMKEISEKIHNTPAILKKNYAAGGIISLYVDQPHRFKRYFFNDGTPRSSLIHYLRDYCKGYKESKDKIVNGGGFNRGN